MKKIASWCVLSFLLFGLASWLVAGSYPVASLWKTNADNTISPVDNRAVSIGTALQFQVSGGVSQYSTDGGLTWINFVPWNNGGKTITNPTTADIYPHYRCFIARHLTQATLLVVGGTSVTGKLQKCSNVGASCSDISDSLTVSAGAEGTFPYSSGTINTALSAGDRVYFVPTAVTGAVTSLTVDLGGVVP